MKVLSCLSDGRLAGWTPCCSAAECWASVDWYSHSNIISNMSWSLGSAMIHGFYVPLNTFSHFRDDLPSQSFDQCKTPSLLQQSSTNYEVRYLWITVCTTEIVRSYYCNDINPRCSIVMRRSRTAFNASACYILKVWKWDNSPKVPTENEIINWLNSK